MDKSVFGEPEPVNEIKTLLEAEKLAGIPPAGGQFTIPNPQEYQAVYNPITKVYKNPDESVRQSKLNSLAMRRSLVIMEPLRARQMATAELSWQIVGEDAKDEEQQEIARQLTRILEDTPNLLQMLMSLLEAVFFGRWGVMLKYGWDFSNGTKRLVIKNWQPIHGDSLVFKYDTHQIGVLIFPWKIGAGTKEFPDALPTDYGRAHFLTPWEREALILHKHEITAGDFTEPETAAGVYGIGLRNYLYYTWNLMGEAHAWLTEYLERVGLGLTIYRFPSGNPEQEHAVRKAAETQAFNNVILWPANNEQKWKDIERIEPNAVGVESLMRVISDYYGGLIKRYIVGQVNVADVGLNRSQTNTELQRETFERIIRFDSANLADSLTRDLISVLMKYNYPECPHRFKFQFNVDKDDIDKYLKAARSFYDMGGDLDSDSLRGKLGLEKPTEDSTVLKRTMTVMEQGEAGSVNDDVEGGEGNDNPEGRNGTKKDKIKQAVNSLGVNATASEVKAALESQGITASRSLVYGTLQELRGSTFKKGKHV